MLEKPPKGGFSASGKAISRSLWWCKKIACSQVPSSRTSPSSIGLTEMEGIQPIPAKRVLAQIGQQELLAAGEGAEAAASRGKKLSRALDADSHLTAVAVEHGLACARRTGTLPFFRAHRHTIRLRALVAA
jgi:hypothetical protein